VALASAHPSLHGSTQMENPDEGEYGHAENDNRNRGHVDREKPSCYAPVSSAVERDGVDLDQSALGRWGGFRGWNPFLNAVWQCGERGMRVVAAASQQRFFGAAEGSRVPLIAPLALHDPLDASDRFDF
jgi:hypothetical protein